MSDTADYDFDPYFEQVPMDWALDPLEDESGGMLAGWSRRSSSSKAGRRSKPAWSAAPARRRSSFTASVSVSTPIRQ